VGSIKWKLILLYVILVVFVILVSGIYIITNVQKNEYQNVYDELEYTSERVIDTLQTAGIEKDVAVEDVLAEVISALMMESVNIGTKNMYLLDGEGDLVYYRDTALSKADMSSRTIIDALEGKEQDSLYVHKVNLGKSSVTVGDYARSFTVRSSKGELTYILFIRQSMTEVESTISNTIMIIVGASIIALLLAGVLSFFLADTISVPIRKLTRKTQEMAKGNLEESAYLLKNFPLTPKGVKGWDFAQATKGGIHMGEVNQATMESLLIPGLYFAGEILDFDGPCGGYNLQNAWETGAVAGKGMAQ